MKNQKFTIEFMRDAVVFIEQQEPVVVSTHGIIKKSKKIEKQDLSKAQASRLNYLKDENK